MDEKIKYELERYRGRVYRDVIDAEDQALTAIKKIFYEEMRGRLEDKISLLIKEDVIKLLEEMYGEEANDGQK